MKYVVFKVLENGDKEELERFDSMADANAFMEKETANVQTFSVEKTNGSESEIIF